MGVRKEHKIVMKSDIAACKTWPIKRISKTFAYLIMKTIWIGKVAKLLFHSIYIYIYIYIYISLYENNKVP